MGETLTGEDGNINLDNEVLGIIRLLSDRLNNSRDVILTTLNHFRPCI
jgi:hypothetical protein